MTCNSTEHICVGNDGKPSSTGAGWFIGILCLLLAAALISGVMTAAAQLRMCNDWKNSPPEIRTDMVLGMFTPSILKTRASVPETEGFLLFSGVDPALLPYALFPRKIWQIQTDPETNRIYMDLPPSPYPQRQPESFQAPWQLIITQDNVMMGGELLRMQPDGSAR